METWYFICGLMIAAVVGGLIGSRHGRTGKGFILGLLLGPVGWALALFDVSGFVIALCFLGIWGLALVAFRVDQHDKDVAAQDRDRERRGSYSERADRETEPTSLTDDERIARAEELSRTRQASATQIHERPANPKQVAAELATQEAARRQREAAEIARKYGAKSP